MKIEDVEELLEQCQVGLKQFEELKETIKKIELDYKNLSDYYEKQYLSDFDNPTYENKPLMCLNEDSIWNTLTSLDIERVELIKILVNNLRS